MCLARSKRCSSEYLATFLFKVVVSRCRRTKLIHTSVCLWIDIFMHVHHSLCFIHADKVLPLGADVSAQTGGRLDWVRKGGWCIWQTTQVCLWAILGSGLYYRMWLDAVPQDVAWCCTTGCVLMIYYRMQLDAVLQDVAWCCTTGCVLMLYYRMWLDAVLQDAAWCCTTGCGLMLYYRMWLDSVLQVKKSGWIFRSWNCITRMNCCMRRKCHVITCCTEYSMCVIYYQHCCTELCPGFDVKQSVVWELICLIWWARPVLYHDDI